MANLWRVLAIAWLGGLASPALMDEPATVADIQSAPMVAESPADASAVSDEAVQIDTETATPAAPTQIDSG